MVLKNFTPHEISLADSEGNIIRSIPSEGNARVSSQSIPAGDIDGFPFVKTVFGEVQGLPPAEDQTFFIVSQIVIAALPDRQDLVRPDTGPTCVRDTEGRIVAVRALTH